MGMLERGVERIGRGIGAMTGWRQIRETGKWMADGAAIASPSRFPWRKRDEWTAPPKAEGTFEGAMLRNGVDEAEVRRRHGVFAWISAVTLVGAIVSAECLVASLATGRAGGAMAGLGMLAVFSASFLAHSFRAWKLRKRCLNADFSAFLAKPGAWIPPVRYSREDGHD